MNLRIGLLLLAAAIPAHGGTHPAIVALAARTTQRIEKKGFGASRHVLIGQLRGCAVAPDGCDAFQSALRADLSAANPSLQFVPHDAVLAFLKRIDFLSIDAYDDYVLEMAARALNAGTLVEENLDWTHSPVRMYISVERISQIGKSAHFHEKVDLAKPSPAKDSTFALKDQEKDIYLQVPVGPTWKDSWAKHAPQCEKCPDPVYPDKALQQHLEETLHFLATISKQGTITNLAVVSKADRVLAESAIRTVSRSHFKPASLDTGEPIAVRTPVVVKFRIPGG